MNYIQKNISLLLLYLSFQVVYFYSVNPVIGTLIMLNKQKQGFIVIL